MRRGDIWTTAGGSDYAGKPRPVVIVQSDVFPLTNSVTICPLTSDVTEVPVIRPLIRPDAKNGLRLTSRLMVDKLTTVPKTKLGQRIGSLSQSDVFSLDRAMVVFLGLVAQL